MSDSLLLALTARSADARSGQSVDIKPAHSGRDHQPPTIPPTGYLPLPIVDGATLTYARFLREYALPRQPCIITNIGRDWPAAKKWTSVRYFEDHDGVDLEHEVQMAKGRPESAEEVSTTVGRALSTVRRTAKDVDWDGTPFYLSAWDYVRGNSGALQKDFTVPRFFERAPAWLANHVVLGNASTDMKWLYIGSRNSGSATHVDTNLSSAWLWVAHGTKEWVCAHGDDHALLTQGTGNRAFGYRADDDEDDDGSVPLPDLFAEDLFEKWPHAKGARLYRGYQQAGQVCFNPSRCVHAVRNVGEGDAVVISLTHNFADATNVADFLFDATRSIREELLPMAQALKPKKVLRTLAKSLSISPEMLAQTLLELPRLVSEERLEEMIACAARGAEGDVELVMSDSYAEAVADGRVPDSGLEVTPEAVADLLRSALHEGLRDVRPAFEEAASALCRALKLVDE